MQESQSKIAISSLQLNIQPKNGISRSNFREKNISVELII